MLKVLMPLACCALVGFSYASAAAIDCDTLYFHGLSRISYEEKAVFPDPARSVLLDIRTQLKKPWSGCGVTAAYDQKGGVTLIKFPSLDAMQKGLSRERMNGSFSGMYLLSDVGNGLGLFEVAQLSINMSGFLTGGLYEAKLCTGHLAFKPRLAREMACSAA